MQLRPSVWPLARPLPCSGERRELDLDTPVLGASLRRRVGRDRTGLAKTGHGEAALIHPLAGQIVGDSKRTALRQVEIMLVTAGRVGVTEDIDGCLAELLQHQRDRVQ